MKELYESMLDMNQPDIASKTAEKFSKITNAVVDFIRKNIPESDLKLKDETRSLFNYLLVVYKQPSSGILSELNTGESVMTIEKTFVKLFDNLKQELGRYGMKCELSNRKLSNTHIQYVTFKHPTNRDVLVTFRLWTDHNSLSNKNEFYMCEICLGQAYKQYKASFK